ncbi:MAG: hypothetical protein AAB608_00620 [Patescibacteria group bacterium]
MSVREQAEEVVESLDDATFFTALQGECEETLFLLRTRGPRGGTKGWHALMRAHMSSLHKLTGTALGLDKKK